MPRVTISGGSLKRAISSAFNAPPAQPIRERPAAPTASGKCQSCQAAPKTTAAKPIIEPTERSMPPVTMTGVRASASNPTSTLIRIDLKEISPGEEIFRDGREDCDLGQQRQQQDPFAVGEQALAPGFMRGLRQGRFHVVFERDGRRAPITPSRPE